VPGRNTSEAGRCRRLRSNIPTGLYRLFADALTQKQIGVIEILKELSEEYVSVRSYCFLNVFKYDGIDALGIVVGLKQEGRHRPMITALLIPFEPYLPK
jgi:hypothetical protein